MTTMTEPRTEVKVMRVGVRCGNVLSKGKRRGETCNHLLARVDIDQWEQAMTDAVEGKCPNDDCGKVYTLGDYR